MSVNAVSNNDKTTLNVITKPAKEDLLDSYQIAENIVKQYYEAEQTREKTIFKNIFFV